MKFEWDTKKAASNKKKHGVSFIEAASLFDDKELVTKQDTRHDYGEDRFQSIGKSKVGPLSVVHTPRGDKTRLISARKPNKKERTRYKFW